MSLLAWLRRLAAPTNPKNAARARRPRSRWDVALPRLEALEDRLAPATIINIIVGTVNSGSLDTIFLGSSHGAPGIITASDGGNAPGTLSTGALISLAPQDISVTAQQQINFPDVGNSAPLALHQLGGHTDTFQTLNTGFAITFAGPANTITTDGANLVFSAGTNLGSTTQAVPNLTINNATGSSSITLTAGTQGVNTGSLMLGGSANAGPGKVALAASLSILNTGGVSNNAVGSTVSMTARTGIGTLASAVTTAAGALAAQTVGGDLVVSNFGSGPLTVGFTGEPTGVTGVQALGATSNVVLSSTSGIFVTRNGDTIKAPGSVNVSTVGAGMNIVTGGSNTGANAAVFSNGNVTLNAGGSLFLGDKGGGAAGAGDVQAGGVINLSAVQDVVLDEGTVVNSAGSGAVSAASGNNTIGLSGNFTLQQTDKAGASIVTHGGPLSVTVGNTSTFTLDSGTGGRLATTLGAVPGNITIAADHMTINDPINAGTTGVVQLQTNSAGQVINLGTADPNTLGLTDAETDQVTAAVLRVGGAANTGGIVVSDAITQAGSGYGALALITGGPIAESVNGNVSGSLTVNKLALQAGKGIGSGAQALTTGASSIAFTNTGGLINIFNTQGLTITGVDTVTTASNTGTTTSVVSNGPLNVAIPVTGAGSVTLQAQKPATNPPPTTDLTVGPSVGVSSTGAGSVVTLQAADNISVPASASVSAAGSIVMTGGNLNPGSTGGISLLGTATASSAVTLTAPGDVTLGIVTITAGSPAAPAGTLSATSTAGSVRDDGIDTTLLTAATYNFTAAKNIGGDTAISRDDVLLQDATFQAALDLAPSVDINTGNGTATINITQNGAGGNVQLRDTDGRFDTRMLGTLTLKGTGTSQFAMIASGTLVQGTNFAGDAVVDSTLTLGAAANDNLLIAATNGNNVAANQFAPITNNGPTGGVTLVASAGKVTVNVQTGITAKGAVNLTAAGNASGNGVTVSSAVTTSGGGITVDSNKDVTLAAALSTTGASGGPITVISAESLAGSVSAGNGAVKMNAGSSLNTSSSNSAITVQAGGAAGQGSDVTLTTANAGTGPVNVTAFVGNIVDGNAAIVGSNTANALNVTGGAITLTANGFTGINLDVLTATPGTAGVTATDPNGPITLRSSSANQLQVNAVTSGAAVALTAGSLTSLHPNDGVADVAGSAVKLTANGPSTGAAGQIGFFTTSAQFFEVAAQTLTATTNDSRLWISALGGAALGGVSAGADTVVLQAVNGNLTSTHAGTTTPDVTAGTEADLLATGPTASLGTPSAPLLVNAGVLNAQVTGGTGSLNVNGVAGDLQVNQALTSGGAVNIGDTGFTLTVANPAVAGHAVIGGAGAVVTITANSVSTINTSGSPDVQADRFVVIATFDIGSAAARLQTAVNRFTAQGRNIFMDNSGPLTFAPIAVPSFPFALTGALDVSAAGTLTVSEPLSAVGDIKLATTSATGDLVIAPGQSISAGQSVSLSAGRSLLLQSNAVIGSRTGGAVALSLGTKSASSNSLISGGVAAGNNFSASGGAGNDVLTIDFTGGASLPNGLTFDGGGGANTLVYSDLNSTRGHVYVLTKTAINRDGGKSNVALANIQGLSVLGSLTNDLFVVQGTPDGSTLSMRGLGGANAIYISSDAPVSRGDLNGIGGPIFLDPGSGPSNLLVVSEYGRTTPDDVTLTSSTMTFTATPKPFSINYAPTSFLRGNVKLVVGGGNDVVRVQGTAAAAVTSLYTIGGNATIFVSTRGGAQNTLLGTLDIDAGTGAAQLIFTEAGSATPDDLTLSANRLVSNTSGFVINYTATGGAFSRGFLVYTGAANDVVTVNGTGPGSYTYVNTGPGPDAVTVNVSGADNDPLIIDGGDNGAPAGNLLFVNDAAGGATSVSTGPGSGLTRFTYPAGVRDVYYFSMDQVFNNPAAG